MATVTKTETVKERINRLLDKLGGADFKTFEWLNACDDLRWFTAAPYEETNGMVKLSGYAVGNTSGKPIRSSNVYVTLDNGVIKANTVVGNSWMLNNAIKWKSKS